MSPQRHGPAAPRRAGFTLAEVAVTLVIVGIGLVAVLQGLHTAKLSAAYTHYRKVARDLALVTLGELESGLYWEELDGEGEELLTGTYAEQGWEDWHYEIALGDQEFREDYDEQNGAYHDSWLAEEERQRRLEDREDEEDEESVVEPFEKVRIKVTFPKLGERPDSIELERWIPWEQVYGAPEGSSAAQPGEEQKKP